MKIVKKLFDQKDFDLTMSDLYYGIYMDTDAIRAYLNGFKLDVLQIEAVMEDKFRDYLRSRPRADKKIYKILSSQKDIAAFAKEFVRNMKKHRLNLDYEYRQAFDIDEIFWEAIESFDESEYDKGSDADAASLTESFTVGDKTYTFEVTNIDKQICVVGFELSEWRDHIDPDELIDVITPLKEIFYKKIQKHFNVDMQHQGLLSTKEGECSIEFKPKLIIDERR